MWFARLMGFQEESPSQVRTNIELQGEYLHSRVNGRRVRCGRLEMPSLAELRHRSAERPQGRSIRLTEVVGDVAALHRLPENEGALFQAASQFNLLEMVAPSVTPEQGVGIYEMDKTQGPACAVACGAGTIFRNYFVPLEGQVGQSAGRQIDCLADLGQALGGPGLWRMQNGYALATEEGLVRVKALLDSASEAERDALRGLLRIGVQHDVEVTGTDHLVTQVYGSALPVSYGTPPRHLWEPLARLVLEASYEATLLAAQARNIDKVYLTLLGGGVFGNETDWIADSILRALSKVSGLDVGIVSYGQSSRTVRGIVADFERQG